MKKDNKTNYSPKEKAGRFVSAVLALFEVIAIGVFLVDIFPVVKVILTVENESITESRPDEDLIDTSNYETIIADTEINPLEKIIDVDEKNATEYSTKSVVEATNRLVISNYKEVLENERDLLYYCVVKTDYYDYPLLIAVRKFQVDESHSTSIKDLDYASEIYSTVSVYSWSQSRKSVETELDNYDLINPVFFTGVIPELNSDGYGKYHTENVLLVARNDADNIQERPISEIKYHSLYYKDNLTEEDTSLTEATKYTDINQIATAYNNALK